MEYIVTFFVDTGESQNLPKEKTLQIFSEGYFSNEFISFVNECGKEYYPDGYVFDIRIEDERVKCSHLNGKISHSFLEKYLKTALKKEFLEKTINIGFKEISFFLKKESCLELRINSLTC